MICASSLIISMTLCSVQSIKLISVLYWEGWSNNNTITNAQETGKIGLWCKSYFISKARHPSKPFWNGTGDGSSWTSKIYSVLLLNSLENIQCSLKSVLKDWYVFYFCSSSFLGYWGPMHVWLLPRRWGQKVSPKGQWCTCWALESCIPKLLRQGLIVPQSSLMFCDGGMSFLILLTELWSPSATSR